MKLPYPLMYLPGFSFLNFLMTQENKELHPENFKDELRSRGVGAKIFRLKSYKSNKYKSSLITKF